jgi:hypothetical protein
MASANRTSMLDRMNTPRRIQLGAAVVIANGLLLLGMTSPAVAQTCQWLTFYCGICPSETFCQNNMPPGCTTVTDVVCQHPFWFCVGVPVEGLCYYQ